MHRRMAEKSTHARMLPRMRYWQSMVVNSKHIWFAHQ